MGYDLRPMDGQNGDPVIRELREEILAADLELLAAFSSRVQAARKIRLHKQEQGYELTDPERERELLERWHEAGGEAISDEALRELFQTVLELSKRESGR
jgi:chorismate mutase